MKLVLAIVNDIHASPIVERLNKRGFKVTRLASVGGFLRKKSVTLLSAVGDDEAIVATKVIEDYIEYQKVRALHEGDEEAYQEASSTIMILPVEEFNRI